MNLMKAKTVAAAVAPLLKVLSNLEGVVEASGATIDANNQKIASLASANGNADIERTQASAIIKALSGIVNPQE